MNTKEYFEKRALATERHSKERSDKYLKKLEKSYKAIDKQIKKDIFSFYEKYSNENQISNIEARKILNLTQLQEYNKYVESIINKSSLSGKNKDNLRQKYIKSKIDRLTSLHNQVQLNLQILTTEYEKSAKKYLIENYKQVYSEQAHTFEDAPIFTFNVNFNAFDERAIENIVKTKWSNKDFSQRIWGHNKNMVREMTNILNTGIALGYSVDKMSNQISKRLDVNYSNAKRLIRTESNYILSEATFNLYKDVKLEQYQFLATLDYKTSFICRSLDKKIFFVKDRKIGVNCNPMHPNCRSTTIPYLKEYEDEEYTRIARGSDGKSYKVPGNMDYKAWYNSLSEQERNQMQVLAKMDKNKSYDKMTYDKYKLIYGKEIGHNLEEFQKMKYSDNDKWVKYKQGKQDKLNSLDYKKEFFGQFSDKEVRIWYKTHDENIISLIDKSKSIEEQARQAHFLRNKYRTEARKMMANREAAINLENTKPNKTFEELIDYKMNVKNLSLEKSYQDIIDTAGKTNKEVNKRFNLD